ncbi:ABC-type transport auxiliary lipoprotein family protein [Maridesulfovibrio sp.]|uniref:ABC-type transport auxiliary lipoprotein family protein n=1 Tax=Maridesulfovibrio sp. TaxID=2795000 RepID=UPI0039EE44B5
MIRTSSEKRYGLVLVILLTFLLPCLVGACVKLERPTLDRKYFTLDAVRPEIEKKSVPIDKNLIVRRVKISPRYEDRDLVYKVGENSFEADYYNSFFVPPSAMITQELRLWMGDSGVFANVLGPESLGTGEYLLEGTVNSIYGDYSTPDRKAVLKMQFILLDNGDPDLPILCSKDFSREIPVQGTGPDALVQAMNKGLQSIFSELEKSLAEVVQHKKGK